MKSLFFLLKFLLIQVILNVSALVANDALSVCSCEVVNVEKGDSLNVRAKADPKSAIIYKLGAFEDSISLLNNNGNYNNRQWFQISKGDDVGWANSDYLNCMFPPQIAKDTIEKRANEFIKILATGNIKKIVTYIHPIEGIRFTPYTYVSLEDDLNFTKEKFNERVLSNKKLIWGAYDGSGEDIEMDFKGYFSKFVYNHNYLNAERVSYNDPIGTNNNVDNSREFYNNSIICEYYFSGFDEKVDGFDWASIRIVFQKYKNEWFVVGIIHNQWTI